MTATDTHTGIQKSTTADDAGRYTVVNLVPGFYDVQASRQGLTTAVRRNQEKVCLSG